MSNTNTGPLPNRKNIKKEFHHNPLPIDNYKVNQVNIQVHTDKITQNETVILIKRKVKTFAYHADSFYRDKGSKRNNFVNPDTDYNVLTRDIKKFYKQRYYLFSKYDRGVKIDEESWYSVTPEIIAKHIASKINEKYG
jgi:hypothetical protein